MALKRLFCLLTCLSLLFTAGTAWSVELHGRSSTQYLWYNDYFTGDKVADFAQYLSITATKIDEAGKLSLTGYGRMTQGVNEGGDFHGRLFYLYGDYTDLYNKADVRLGRQFVNYAAGSALVDGLKVDLKNVGPVAFSVMGGRNVIFNLESESTKSQDYVWGVAANLVGFKNTDAELSYIMKLDAAGIARDQIGASFKQYMYNSLKFYTNARFDTTSEKFSEMLLGLKYYPSTDLVLTGEWYLSNPIFDNSSIYSVFDVGNYKEAVLRADYRINDTIGVNAGYTRQIYGDGDNGQADVIEIGTNVRPTEKLLVNLNYDYQEGYGGKLNGGALEVVYSPIKPLDLSGGVHYDMYERDRVTGRETARKYWAGGKYRINKAMTASLRIEDNVNQQYKSDWAGRAAFNFDF